MTKTTEKKAIRVFHQQALVHVRGGWVGVGVETNVKIGTFGSSFQGELGPR